MRYIVDGYNFLFALLPVSDDLQAQRNAVISDLANKCSFLQLHITIVFDAPFRGSDLSHSFYKDLEIFYTGEGETADDFIFRLIKASSHPEQIQLVTSDKTLAWGCRQLGASCQSPKSFHSLLEKRLLNKARKEHIASAKKTPPSLPDAKIVLKEQSTAYASPPLPANSIEDSFDYYLYHFEKKFRENEQKSHEEKKNTRKKKN